ncbi:MAG: hypothetical protein GX606_01700 [Elusimicrobia bacterium]|nr:hypothetical protein [Elusimicrobiota bacterium]
MISLLPLAISCLNGYLLLRLLLKDLYCARDPLLLAMSGPAGLGISGIVTFASLLMAGRLLPGLVIALHLGLAAVLTWSVLRMKKTTITEKAPQVPAPITAGLGLLVLPTAFFAWLYPYGGWDAWSLWNLKARFLFLGGENWTGMFAPVMNSHHPSYPILLPLITAWHWCWGTGADHLTPRVLTCAITLMALGLLFSAIRRRTGDLLALIMTGWLGTLPFFVQMAGSQYADIWVGTFFLLAAVSLLEFLRTKTPRLLIVTGAALAFMGFTKLDGILLGAITLIIGLYALRAIKPAGTLPALLLSFGAFSLPTIVWLLFFVPHGQDSFINGLTSTTHPVTLLRFFQVLIPSFGEIVSLKWHGLWPLLLIAGPFLVWKRGRTAAIILSAMGTYLITVVLFYWINTHDPAIWWVTTSFHRILFSFTPAAILALSLFFEPSK